MKLLLASVAIALAGNSAPPALPKKLPANVAGFEFGDNVYQLKQKCEKFPGWKSDVVPRFMLFKGRDFAVCNDIPLGKSYLPKTGNLSFHIQSDRMWLMAAEVPTEHAMEHARTIAKWEGAGVERDMHCAPFPDGVGAVCVELMAKRLSFQLPPPPPSE